VGHISIHRPPKHFKRFYFRLNHNRRDYKDISSCF